MFKSCIIFKFCQAGVVTNQVILTFHQENSIKISLSNEACERDINMSALG